MKIEKLESHSIIQDLTKLYETDWKKEHPYDKKPRLYFYVSDAGKCKRQLFYQFIQPEKKRPMSPGTIMTFKLGDLFHDEVQQNLRRLKYTTSKDIEFGTFGSASFDPRGRLDLFIKEENQLVITDIKSKNSYAFQDEPGEDEVDQLLFYIYQCKQDKLLKAKKMKIADYGYLLYVDRGGLSDVPFCIWKVEYSEEKVEALRIEFSNLWTDIQEKKIPMRGYERDSIRCQYCRFQGPCWEGIPKPSQPVFVADETIEKPEQELVESMAARFIELQKQGKEIEAELETTKNILLKYFKATGQESISINGQEIYHLFSQRVNLDVPYLYSKLKDVWYDITIPQIKLIQKAIKEGKVDPEVFERSKQVEFIEQIKIRKQKGDKK